MDELSKLLDLENAYAFYLKKVKLNPETMLPVQKIETKRAFYAGVSIALVIGRDVIGEMDDENKAVLTFADLWNQCEMFLNLKL